MTITTGGNVGIGTTAPSTLLHIHKDQNTDTELRVQNSSDTSSATATINLVGSQGSTLVLRANPSTSAAPDTTRASIKATSNVYGINLKAESTAGTLQFYTGGGAAANERLRITAAGNVGIGTTSPTSKLDVEGSTRLGGVVNIDRTAGTLANLISLQARGAAEASNFGNPFGNGAGEISTSGLTGLIIGTISASSIVLGTNNTERMRILAVSGNVAIGATTAASKLTVTSGDVEVATIASGLILKSPDGTRYRITVPNGGASLTITAV
jgi:hypothetical protein